MRPLSFVQMLCILLSVITTYLPVNCQQGTRTAQGLTMQPRSVFKLGKKHAGSLAFSPDGRTLAIGPDGGDAQLWDITTERLLGVLPGHRTVNFLAFSPDGRTLGTVDVYTVRIWDVAKKTLKIVLPKEDVIMHSLAFSADSRRVATLSSAKDYSVKLWDAETGRLDASLPRPDKGCNYCGGVYDVALSSDGRTLAMANFYRVHLWDVASLQLRTTLVDDNLEIMGPTWFSSIRGLTHGDTIYTIMFSPDGKTLATASRDGTAKLWNAETGGLLAILKGHKGRVHRLAFSPNGQTLATGSDDKTAKLWDVATGQLKATLQHRGTVWSISFSADSKLIVTASDNEKDANVWNTEKGELVAKLPKAHYPVLFSPDGQTIATAGEKHTVLLWDVPTK